MPGFWVLHLASGLGFRVLCVVAHSFNRQHRLHTFPRTTCPALGSRPTCLPPRRGLPDFRGTILGVLEIRFVAFWGLHWVPLVCEIIRRLKRVTFYGGRICMLHIRMRRVYVHIFRNERRQNLPTNMYVVKHKYLSLKLYTLNSKP